MEALLGSLVDARPDLVVVSGDFTQRARHVEFAEARRFLDRISIPKLVTPGNHDVPLYNLFSRYFTPFRKYDHYIAPLDQPLGFFQDNEIGVLGLNTARRFTRKNGRLSQLQIATIRRVFDPIPQEATRVIVTHHPLAVPGAGERLELAGSAEDALKAIADAGVHLLLSGHHHQALSGPIAEIGGAGAVLIVHAGTAISTRTRGLGGNSYNLISIDGRTISVRVMAWAKATGFLDLSSASYAFNGTNWNQQLA